MLAHICHASEMLVFEERLALAVVCRVCLEELWKKSGGWTMPFVRNSHGMFLVFLALFDAPEARLVVRL